MKLSVVTVLVLFALLALGHDTFGQTQPPAGAPPQLDGFVPADTLPPAEQLPAARLLIVAYAFVWVAVFLYVWSLWKRLGQVEGELRQLARKTAGRQG
jgi:CcmD family protein